MTNGQLGELIDTVKTKNGDVEKLIVNLKKRGSGTKNRRRFPGLAAKYPNSVIIERVSVTHSIRKKGGKIGSTATLIQFPVKLAQAITGHKIQGQTIPKPLKVAYDLADIFDEAQGYVMLSRVQELEQIFILNKFNPDKLYPSKKALGELERMNKISINQNPAPWNKEKNKNLKIASLNCAGLKAHFQDIQTDDRLLQADILHLIESSLTKDDMENDLKLEGFETEFITRGLGKGIATYYKPSKFIPSQTVNSENFQITKFRHEDLDIINIYRSQLGNSVQVLETVKKLLTTGIPTLISGDFNICFIENKSNRLIEGLLSMGFEQLIHEPTHVRGRHIDHVYFRDPTYSLRMTLERYSPYYSDHDGICITFLREED